MNKLRTSSSHRTKELTKYLLSDEVEIDSTEFLPQQAAIDVLQTTAPTLKHRIEERELNEKTFFLTNPVKKTFLGVEIGGVKRLLLKKNKMRTKIFDYLDDTIKRKKLTSYADVMEQAGMHWKSPADRKFCNKVLAEISSASYEETVDMGYPCLKTAVVVSRNERIPTVSFFDLAIDLGLLNQATTKNEHIEFWESQVQLVYQYYGR